MSSLLPKLGSTGIVLIFFSWTNTRPNFIEKGNVFYDAHNYLEAIKCYEESIQANRRVKEAWLLKGISLREIGKPCEAINCFNESIKLGNNYVDAYIEKAYTHYVLGDYIPATECFDEVLKIHPKSPEAMTGKGTIAVDQGRYHDAIIFYYKAIGNRQDLHLSYIYENIGNTYYKIGKTRYNDALDNYDKAIAMNPNRVMAIFKKGLIFDSYGNKIESDKNFAKVLDLDPNFVYLSWIHIGGSLEEEDKYDEAITYFNKSLEPNSSFKSLALMNIGLILSSTE